MVAEEGHRAAAGVFHHRFERRDRVGPVADVIAEKNVAIDPATAGMVEAGLERLAVAVDVGEQCDPHVARP